MGKQHGETTELQRLLVLLRAGDESARSELICRACERLRLLARKMLRRYPGLKRWEETDDVLQNALIRLHRSLAKVKPDSVRRFFGLSAIHIRRELFDLIRHHFGPQGVGANHATGPAVGAGCHEKFGYVGANSTEPDSLADWAEFHEQVEMLPAQEREVVHLLFYQGVTQIEASALLGISQRTLKRRWHDAKLLIHRALTEDKAHPRGSAP